MKILKLPKDRGLLILVSILLEDHSGLKLEDIINTNLFQIIGRYSVLSDKTFDDFVEPMYLNADLKDRQRFGYMNYVHNINIRKSVHGTAKESFRSLMTSQDIYINEDFLIAKIK